MHEVIAGSSNARNLWIPGFVLTTIVIACLLGPSTGLVPPPIGGMIENANLPILSAKHVLGTDVNGNDVLSRLLHGGRTSLWIALCANVSGLIVGFLIGTTAGYFGGWIDSAFSRFIDVVVAFPALVLAIALIQCAGPGADRIAAVLLIYSVPAFARLARSATVKLKAMPFMLAADLTGVSHSRILFLHVAPNILPQMTTFLFLGTSVTIVVEGALSFLGLGVPAPAPSWGNMIAQGQQQLSTRPELALMPGCALLVTSLCLNLVGERLRERSHSA